MPQRVDEPAQLREVGGVIGVGNAGELDGDEDGGRTFWEVIVMRPAA